MKKDIEPSTRKNVTLSNAMWEAVSEYRHRHRIGSEVAALRLLLQEAITKAAKEKA